MELPFTKNYSLQKILAIALGIVFGFLIVTIVPLHYPSEISVRYIWSTLKNSNSSELAPQTNHAKNHTSMSTVNIAGDEKCDIFTGEWVPNPEAPYYTNNTCPAMHAHQNCMKNGRPDTGFTKWRWKPDGCDLPVFNPYQFLDIVRGKSMAFVGDSVARNHMQSLFCLLTKEEYPIDISYTEDDRFKRWNYTSYNFILAVFWAPVLVRVETLYKFYIDEFDDKWTTQIQEFDYVIISAGHWFKGGGMYYENRLIVGCRLCQMNNMTELPATYGFRRAFRTAFRALNSLNNYKGITILLTFASGHFENGEFDSGGNCIRKVPFKRDEIKLDGGNLEFYKIQLEEFRAAERIGKRKGLKFRLLDATKAMLLRPDGHPDRYFMERSRPRENVTSFNDCVHWCLPGPIDSCNDFLLHMLKMEGRKS